MAGREDTLGLKASMPPQNIEAEMAVIASVCLMRDAFDEVSDLKPEHFYADRHGRMWSVLTELHRDKIGIDAVTMAEKLEGQNLLAEVGNVEYIGRVLESVPNAAHVRYYANIVISRWRMRTATYGCAEIIRRINENSEDDEVVAEAEKVLAAIAERACLAQDVAISDVMVEAWTEIQARLGRKEAAGMATGFIDLDKLIVGIQPTELIVIAARPACGKSAFAGCLIHRLAKRGISSLLLSLEMSRLEFAERLLCAESGVSATKLKAGDCLDEFEVDSLMMSSGVLSKLPIRIDEQGRQKVSAIAAIARRAQRVHGTQVIVIDYLQLIEPDQRLHVREQEVASITKALKGLAKELKLPVIVLAQLNRAVENREDKKPRLADLRESGAVEQDANQVWFLHRPEVYDPADRPAECDVIVAKNRGGATGTVTLAWRANTTEFKDFASSEWEAGERASNAFNPPKWVG